MKLLNKLITLVKKEEYELDENIPLGYIFSLIFEIFFMMIRGFFVRNKKEGFLFVNKNVKIKCKKKFFTGRNVAIGKNCTIDALSINGIHLGDNVSIHKNTIIEATGSLRQIGKGLKIGSNTGISSNCFFGCAGGIEIGSDTIMGNYVTFHSENHNFSDKTKLIRKQGVSHKGIKIGSNCWIGAKTTILDGTVVEDGCVIAAGSLLLEGRYGKNSVYAGVPAKLIKDR